MSLADHAIPMEFDQVPPRGTLSVFSRMESAGGPEIDILTYFHHASAADGQLAAQPNAWLIPFGRYNMQRIFREFMFLLSRMEVSMQRNLLNIYLECC